MFDRALNAALQRPLQSLASTLIARVLHADQMTWVGMAVFKTEGR